MDPNEQFANDVRHSVADLSNDTDLQSLSRLWVREVSVHKWAYNFSWLGRPAIQFPNDAWAMQELVWRVRPDLIIETGIAHGGSLIFYASLLALLDLTDADGDIRKISSKNPRRKVLGIDIDIRPHNLSAIKSHPLANRLELIQGSSVEQTTFARVSKIAEAYSRVMVCLDSNHTHDHVLSELELYSKLVSVGSYCVVFDTLIEDMPKHLFTDRPWGPGNNPKTAVWKFLEQHPKFEIDKDVHNKLLITVAPDGFLKRVE